MLGGALPPATVEATDDGAIQIVVVRVGPVTLEIHVVADSAVAFWAWGDRLLGEATKWRA